jgi:pyruvyltransferase
VVPGEAVADVSGVLVVHWNPPAWQRSRPDRWVRRKRMDNFGDLLGPLIARRLLSGRHPAVRPAPPARLLTVGSILHLGRPGDVVWGSGLNGYNVGDDHATALDVRAVRGPVTRRFLLSQGADAPEVYGDPGLLLPEACPELRQWATTKRHELTVVPNLWEAGGYRARYGERVVWPRSDLEKVLRRIAQSELVVGSSLHGLIVAESLGIPARLVTPGSDPLVKYEDYYGGTGRDRFAPAETVEEAVRVGGEPAPSWSPDALLATFPIDLWQDGRAGRG